MDALQKQLDQGKKIDFSTIKMENVCALLVRYYTMLPSPLIGHNLYSKFIKFSSFAPNSRDMKSALNTFVSKGLPRSEAKMLGYTVRFLRGVSLQESKNNLTLAKLADLFRIGILRKKSSIFSKKGDSKVEIDLIIELINNYEEVFKGVRVPVMLTLANPNRPPPRDIEVSLR